MKLTEELILRNEIKKRFIGCEVGDLSKECDFIRALIESHHYPMFYVDNECIIVGVAIINIETKEAIFSGLPTEYSLLLEGVK